MTLRTLMISLFILCGCKGTAGLENIHGIYYKQGKDYRYSLKLDKDKTFVLSQKYFEGIATCHGKWQWVAKDTILLQCSDEELTAKFSSGYMSVRERNVVVLSQNTLKVDKMVLKRMQ